MTRTWKLASRDFSTTVLLTGCDVIDGNSEMKIYYYYVTHYSILLLHTISVDYIYNKKPSICLSVCLWHQTIILPTTEVIFAPNKEFIIGLHEVSWNKFLTAVVFCLRHIECKDVEDYLLISPVTLLAKSHMDCMSANALNCRSLVQW